MAGFVNPSAPPAASGPYPGRPADRLPTTTLELSLRCTKLPDRDYLSKSDPVAVLFMKSSRSSPDWREIGRTERLADILNPIWKQKFVVDYSFEEQQPVKIEIYDWDTNDKEAKGDLKKQDFLGRLECTLASIVSAPQKQYVAVLRDSANKGAGQCFVVAEEVTSNKEIATLHFAANGLDKKDLFGKSDPFFMIYRSLRASQSGQHTLVHKSNIVKNNLNPSWEPFTISLRDLCNGDYERQLKFEVYDWDNDGSHDLIGSFTTTLEALKVANVEKTEFKCVNPKKAQKKGYKDSGKLYLKSIQIVSQPSFVDYIQGGTVMNFSVAVDFTASNGHPSDSRSLHFRNPQTGENQYTQAIRAVGEIINDYDTDKQYPALGFGGKIPPHGQVSHEFFLNLSDNPYCEGVQGILQAYQTSLHNVELYGPTNFSPVINHVARFAATYQDGRQYFVLLILTDGIITDFEETKTAIVAASALPMSIIIVGVGNEDFSAMEELDSDKGLLRARGRVAARDIVQFVEMRRYMCGNGMWDREGLAREVLAEVPKQVVAWMTVHGLKPVNT